MARSTDGTAITYDVRPGGLPAIVFIHGLGGDPKAWNRTRAHAEEDSHRPARPLMVAGTHTLNIRQPEIVARKIASFATAPTPKSQ